MDTRQLDDATYERFTKIIAVWAIIVAFLSFLVTFLWVIYQYREKEKEKAEQKKLLTSK